jgi:hypothetical protein
MVEGFLANGIVPEVRAAQRALLPSSGGGIFQESSRAAEGQA